MLSLEDEALEDGDGRDEDRWPDRGGKSLTKLLVGIDTPRWGPTSFSAAIVNESTLRVRGRDL